MEVTYQHEQIVLSDCENFTQCRVDNLIDGGQGNSYDECKLRMC